MQFHKPLILIQELTKASNKSIISSLPKQKKHPNQKIFIVNIDGSAHIVPFVEDDNKYFLKTIYKSREATRIYLNRKEEK